MDDISDLTTLESVKQIRKNQVDHGCHAVMLNQGDARSVRVAWLEHLRDDYHWIADNQCESMSPNFVLLGEK